MEDGMEKWKNDMREFIEDYEHKLCIVNMEDHHSRAKMSSDDLKSLELALKKVSKKYLWIIDKSKFMFNGRKIERKILEFTDNNGIKHTLTDKFGNIRYDKKWDEVFLAEPLIFRNNRELSLSKKEYKMFYGEEMPDFPKKPKSFYWVTITGKDRIPDNEEMIENMEIFGSKIFQNLKFERFSKVIWNIETGKYPDKPNLHLHAVVIFKKSAKNFKRDAMSLWKRTFPDYDVDYHQTIFNKCKNLENILKDKINYMNNVDKSILHENYRDLGIKNEL